MFDPFDPIGELATERALIERAHEYDRRHAGQVEQAGSSQGRGRPAWPAFIAWMRRRLVGLIPRGGRRDQRSKAGR